MCAGLPYLRADELVEVGGDVEADPVDGSRQGDPAEEEDEQHEVGIGGWEIDHLGERESQKLVIHAELKNEENAQVSLE